ncbi:OmpA family protein [Oceanibacterium hippocampi]|uniref:Outer membrane protein n=1 Tax=Oceanibacterium hippocampi TaxID=745714 RepID=A0A1Y5U4Z6_9PROT|nr:OmpA family protein [Oceanibacterium hippocampi]SLN77116.1 Outer membrane protein precursor [Oceanibacterium hippocampi]
MIRSAKFVIVATFAALLTGCAGFQLDHARDVTAEGTSFDKALYKVYLDLSAAEYEEGDYADSDTFAMRAIAAAKGELVLPEEIESRELPADRVSVLRGARERLMSAFSKGARDNSPAEAAMAQGMFDCWMQEQEENFQPRDIAACRDGFIQAIEKVEAMMPKPVAQPAPAPAPAPKAPEVPRSYLVFFDWDSSKVLGEADSILADVAGNMKLSGAKGVALVGHADRSGPNSYNMGLSLRRAEAVQAALQAMGIPASVMEVNARGEEDPLVLTDDGVREPQNRRVEIMLK